MRDALVRGWTDRRLRRAPVWRDTVSLAADLADLCSVAAGDVAVGGGDA